LFKKLSHQQGRTTSGSAAASNAYILLNAVAKWAPRIVKGHLAELERHVVLGDGSSKGDGGQVALRLLANLVRADPEVKLSASSRTLEKITTMVLETRNRELAKFAARSVVLGATKQVTVQVFEASCCYLRREAGTDPHIETCGNFEASGRGNVGCTYCCSCRIYEVCT